MMYMKKQPWTDLPMQVESLVVPNNISLTRGHDHGWDYEEYECDPALHQWLDKNIASAEWRVNRSTRAESEVIHVESLPRHGMKMAYFTRINGEIMATWVQEGRVVHQERVEPRTWYVMRMDVEHVAL